MFYYLYEIKNLINGKIYVGVHKTRNMNDGYMGSGKVILSAIKKHGRSNFQKVILETFEDAKSMYAREREVVTEDFLSREDVYNLRRGGFGGFDWINKKGFIRNQSHFDVGNAESIKGGLATRDRKIAIHSNEAKLNATRVLKKLFPNGTFYGKKHSVDTVSKMKESHAGMQTGNKNSQFGTMWITDGVQNKKCNRSSTIPTGWKPGRNTVTNVPIDYVG